MKGIILSAGKGTRLYPATKPVCKPLIPLYDKPLIYYPLDVLLRAGITEILIIVPAGPAAALEQLFRDSSSLGISISYKGRRLEGMRTLYRRKDFIGEMMCLVLGDNVFYGPDWTTALVRPGKTIQGLRFSDTMWRTPDPLVLLSLMGMEGSCLWRKSRSSPGQLHSARSIFLRQQGGRNSPPLSPRRRRVGNPRST